MKFNPKSLMAGFFIISFVVIVATINYATDIGIKASVIYTYHFTTASCLLLAILRIICHIINILDGHNEKKPIFTTIVLLLISCLHIPFACNIGSTQIGDLYEKTEYSEMYNVFMSELPKDSGKRTVYKLPAKITRTGDMPTYIVYRIYFNNGGYLTFSEFGGEVIPDKETKVMDENGETYYVTLTRTKSDE